MVVCSCREHRHILGLDVLLLLIAVPLLYSFSRTRDAVGNGLIVANPSPPKVPQIFLMEDNKAAPQRGGRGEGGRGGGYIFEYFSPCPIDLCIQ